MNSDETEDNDFSISSDKKQEGKEDIVFILYVQEVLSILYTNHYIKMGETSWTNIFV